MHYEQHCSLRLKTPTVTFGRGGFVICEWCFGANVGDYLSLSLVSMPKRRLECDPRGVVC